MYDRNQRACRVQQLAAELILWITAHVSSKPLKSGGRAHLDPLLSKRRRGSGPQDPHKIAATDCHDPICDGWPPATVVVGILAELQDRPRD